uniref:Cysteine protease n=3 Tax=Gasterosteus aculeatus TaxID=69293 RepID=A0AAQ4QAJ6_GASAC|nr:cysteine protease ATG4D-like isoform X1 [Gasterosteus aculeatus aculeatus]XP_040048001.1 cysteine protease ATG4D-like isoform X1 [Gasterosteus aculeatus aculeatus]
MNPNDASAHCEDNSSPDDPMDDWLFLSTDSAVRPGPEVSGENLETEDRGPLKTKLISVWNSVKYGWSLKHKSKFSKSSAVIMFGQSYELRDHDERENFRRSFASVLWLTYRRGFPQLAGGSLTTDSGWGCVLRTGQMLLAQGLIRHQVPPGCTRCVGYHAVKDDLDLLAICPAAAAERGLDAKEGPNKFGRHLSLDSLMDRPKEAHLRRVVSWFADSPTAPFGIHKLVELGKSSGKKAGDWYGPSIVAHILRKAVAASADLPDLVVYVAQDCTVYLEDVKRLCERPLSQPWKAVIILVPVRLGGQDLNPSYVTCVKKLLSLQCCIGIIGGKPKHSLFFIGFQDDHVLYLDPHYCQPAVDVTRENFPLESFHCKYPRKMSFCRMDPSCTIGFYAKGQKDFEALRTDVNQALSISAETYPMFIFAEGSSQEEEQGGTHVFQNNIAYIQRKTERRRVDTCNSMDEFVLL